MKFQLHRLVNDKSSKVTVSVKSKNDDDFNTKFEKLVSFYEQELLPMKNLPQ